MRESDEILRHINQEFASLIDSLKDLVKSVPVERAENILRSAAVIEQTCGGLTANLWDDPFEWTLPETLSSPERIIEYLSEVDKARQRAFSAIGNDAALLKYISDPSGEPRVLIGLLLETLVKASHYYGRAATACRPYGC
jgi:hypothetical protein